MQLTRAQEIALFSIKAWLSDYDKQEFILAGFAGTGKTTLLQEFINSRDELVLCVAPTGKAASVLSKRLENVKVTTIHSALYKPVAANPAKLEDMLMELVGDPDNKDLREAIERERERLEQIKLGFAVNEKHRIEKGQLVIVDEASMVTGRIREDLYRTGAKVLYVGDPGQLPPVRDKGFFAEAEPDVMLTEILRQALDSPIIRLSMDVRNGHSISFGEYSSDGSGSVVKVPKESVSPETWLSYDQVITGKNDSRRKINRYFRTKKYPGNRSVYPMKGDKLICLKNEAEDGVYYINGVPASSLDDAVKCPNQPWVIGKVLYEDEILEDVVLWPRAFEMHYSDVKEDLPFERLGMRQFDYAYAITVHKSQGSEWDRVLLADDQMQSQDRDFRKLWLYTAITRAKSELLWLV